MHIVYKNFSEGRQMMPDKDKLIKDQYDEIQKLKKELKNATKPSTMFSVLKSTVKRNIHDFFNREDKMKNMEARMKELEEENAKKSDELNRKSAELFAVINLGVQDNQDLENKTNSESDSSDKDKADFSMDFPQSQDEAVKKYFGSNINLKDLAKHMNPQDLAPKDSSEVTDRTASYVSPDSSDSANTSANDSGKQTKQMCFKGTSEENTPSKTPSSEIPDKEMAAQKRNDVNKKDIPPSDNKQLDEPKQKKMSMNAQKTNSKDKIQNQQQKPVSEISKVSTGIKKEDVQDTAKKTVAEQKKTKKENSISLEKPVLSVKSESQNALKNGTPAKQTDRNQSSNLSELNGSTVPSPLENRQKKDTQKPAAESHRNTSLDSSKLAPEHTVQDSSLSILDFEPDFDLELSPMDSKQQPELIKDSTSTSSSSSDCADSSDIPIPQSKHAEPAKPSKAAKPDSSSPKEKYEPSEDLPVDFGLAMQNDTPSEDDLPDASDLDAASVFDSLYDDDNWDDDFV